MKRMGQRIRARREHLSIQVNDLAGIIGVTPSLISQIERAKAFPSILTLKKIADALQVSVGDLIGETASFVVHPYLNSKERKFVKKNKNGARLYLLSHHDPTKQMDPFILRFDKDSDSTDIMTTANPRQEFCYVLKGHFKAILNTTEYDLKEGDSFYFNSSQYYLFRNVGNESAELLWIVNQMSI
jgi:transcriptional regulator with XRE-family HTH domain